jgi:3D (Asp-Asp-Asp) domain-containing protein
VSIAVDPGVIPYGSWVYIDGYGWHTAHDTGIAPMAGRVIDIWVDDRSKVPSYGIDFAECYVLRKGGL